jgi:hypothetical protein
VRKFAKTVKTVPGKGHLLITSTEGDEVEVPFSWFEASGNSAPNFGDLEVIDHGQTIRLGDYEVRAELVFQENLV